MTVSIVIPVYNEAEHLAACLQAIACQTAMPYEVIIVDNNSTDGTVAIAESYPFVQIMHESRQGVVYARDRGFTAARGDIIGRLDADSLLAPDWIASVEQLFSEDPELAAVSGKVRYYGLALSGILDTIDLRIRRRMARLLGREVAIQGANMAVRRTAWHRIKSGLCHHSGMHEDHDLGIHLFSRGYKVSFDEQLVTALDCRRVESGWFEFCRYVLLSPQTYARHSLKSRRHMYPIVGLAIAFHLPLKLLYRGYDVRTERFSWRQLLGGSAIVRVNPGIFVE